MTDREKWLALAERCEKATGPDREIDYLVSAAVGNIPEGCRRNGAFSWICPRPSLMTVTYHSPVSYTASLDAITDLIERELPKAGWEVCGGKTRDKIASRAWTWLAWAWFEGSGILGKSVSRAKTPALALCAAFCRAKAEMCGDEAKDE